MPDTLIVFSPTTTTGAVGGFSLAEYRDRLADRLGFHQVTTVTATASGSDPNRVVIADELRDDEADYGMAAATWLYVRTGAQAGTQRRVISDPEVGYQGAGSALVVSRPFASPLEPGSTIELTSPLPVRRHLGQLGLVECVNEALAQIIVEARLELAGTGLDTHALTGYPWVTGEHHTTGLFDGLRQATDAAALRSLWASRLVVDGETVTLVTEGRYSVGEPFWLGVLVPADRMVYDGGAWSYVTRAGLWADTHRAAAPLGHVLAFGMMVASEQLHKLALSRPDGVTTDDARVLLAESETMRLRWTRAAAAIKRTDMTRQVPARTRPLVSV